MRQAGNVFSLGLWGGAFIVGAFVSFGEVPVWVSLFLLLIGVVLIGFAIWRVGKLLRPFLIPKQQRKKVVQRQARRKERLRRKRASKRSHRRARD